MASEILWEIGDTRRGLPEHVDPVEQQFQFVKSNIHQKMVESLDLSRLKDIERSVLVRYVRDMAHDSCGGRGQILSQIDQERLVDELMWEVFGLGPLEPLMRDPNVTDVLVNDPYNVYVERRGRMELTDVIFANDDHLMRIIQRIVARLGRRIDATSPMVDARLPDGSRVNAIVPPLALDGPSLSIRRFGVESLKMPELVENDSIHPDFVEFLAAAVEARVGILISGGTGAGKTTFLNSLSSYIPLDERLVTIEDSAELTLQHKHRVRLETRPPNTEGAGAVTQRDLVRNSLRMRPDRILVGEVRGAEVWDMLQAMNTGHEGSMTTIHANSARDALSRLEMMVAMSGFELPVNVVRSYVAAGIKLLVHVARLKGGSRKIVQVCEVAGVHKGRYDIEEIFGFDQIGVDAEQNAQGYFFAAGYRPRCLRRISAYGVSLPDSIFDEGRRIPESGELHENEVQLEDDSQLVMIDREDAVEAGN